jgi:uncharacterized protein (DUF433 family)
MVPTGALEEEARSVHAQSSRLDDPAYTPAAAARYLLVPVSTVRWWTLGNGAHPPVIHIADPDGHRLSYRNLVEVHVLSGVMRQDRNRIPIALVRGVVTLLGEMFQSKHPLADARMREEGKDFFAARLGILLDATRYGQLAIASMLDGYLARIRRDERGEPVRLLVFSRGRPDGPEHIAIDPLVRGGEPCVTGTQLATSEIAARFRAGASVKDLAETLARAPPEIEEAIRYESETK